MKKGFLTCQIKESNPYTDDYLIFVQLSKNQTEQGTINKKHFIKNQLEVEIIGEKNNQAIILLPEKIQGQNAFEVDYEFLKII